MNESNKPPLIPQTSLAVGPQQASRLMNVNFPLDSELYREIRTELARLSLRLGYDVTMSKFLRKVVVDNWILELERYKKLDPAPKRIRLLSANQLSPS